MRKGTQCSIAPTPVCLSRIFHVCWDLSRQACHRSDAVHMCYHGCWASCEQVFTTVIHPLMSHTDVIASNPNIGLHTDDPALPTTEQIPSDTGPLTEPFTELA